ncbi:HIT domain-containing protein [Candidatus Bipolaricaulota bacterium]|nr:HIT domain-containing protein [Candidatus Bipolaricaulota bacterium]
MPFCSPAQQRIVAESELAVALRDGFPVSPGHTLVVPRRHVQSFFYYMGPWKPATENQATNRVHRIGQEKEVHVYLPIATWPDGTSESVERVLNELIKTKTALATDIIVPTAEYRWIVT